MTPEFLAWYELYPRKVSKKDAFCAWRQMTQGQKFAAFESLPMHVRYWTAAGTTKEFLPYPASWLRGERWEDELAMPENSDSDWHKSQGGIESKAREMGMWPPKSGEGWHELKARILAKTRAA